MWVVRKEFADQFSVGLQEFVETMLIKVWFDIRSLKTTWELVRNTSFGISDLLNQKSWR